MTLHWGSTSSPSWTANPIVHITATKFSGGPIESGGTSLTMDLTVKLSVEGPDLTEDQLLASAILLQEALEGAGYTEISTSQSASVGRDLEAV